MPHRHATDRTRVRLMNEYTVELPLWGPEGLADDDAFELSDDLRSDLLAFAERWQDIHAWVAQDADDSIGGPFEPATYPAENEALRIVGERLRDRLQAELGRTYDVVYQH